MQANWAKRGISFTAMLAVLVQGPAAVSKPGPGFGHTGRSGLCRHPDALPKLAAEGQDQQKRPRPFGTPESVDSVDGPPPPAPMMAPPPPPPPPPVAPASKAETADVVVTGTAAPAPVLEAPSPVTVARSDDGAEPSARPVPAPPRPESTIAPRRPQYQPQPGILTAGEHDDLLNPELYSLYQRRSNLGQEVRGLPSLDTSRVLTVAVKDARGRPVPFAPVEVACSDGGSLQLSTTADGTVSLFPDLDRLGSKVRVRAVGAPWREVGIARSGGQRIDFTSAQSAQAVTKLDLMLVIDTTGSMGDEIRYLQSELASILASIRQNHPGVDIRVGFVFYRDVGDEYVTRTVPLTRDFAAAQGQLSQQFADGGGDYPEAMEQALIRAAGQQWRGDAVKSMLLVADAPPHDEKIGLAWQASEVLRANRVQIVPVAASGVADKAEYVMRAMAALTQSRYTFLTDDSGVGNPHAAPAIDCYLVTRLNALLVRVIDSQLSGRRVEPREQEIIRTVGTYDNGKCVIPPGGWPQQ